MCDHVDLRIVSDAVTSMCGERKWPKRHIESLATTTTTTIRTRMMERGNVVQFIVQAAVVSMRRSIRMFVARLASKCWTGEPVVWVLEHKNTTEKWRARERGRYCCKWMVCACGTKYWIRTANTQTYITCLQACSWVNSFFFFHYFFVLTADDDDGRRRQRLRCSYASHNSKMYDVFDANATIHAECAATDDLTHKRYRMKWRMSPRCVIYDQNRIHFMEIKYNRIRMLVPSLPILILSCLYIFC